MFWVNPVQESSRIFTFCLAARSTAHRENSARPLLTETTFRLAGAGNSTFALLHLRLDT